MNIPYHTEIYHICGVFEGERKGQMSPMTWIIIGFYICVIGTVMLSWMFSIIYTRKVPLDTKIKTLYGKINSLEYMLVYNTPPPPHHPSPHKTKSNTQLSDSLEIIIVIGSWSARTKRVIFMSDLIFDWFWSGCNTLVQTWSEVRRSRMQYKKEFIILLLLYGILYAIRCIVMSVNLFYTNA